MFKSQTLQYYISIDRLISKLNLKILILKISFFCKIVFRLKTNNLNDTQVKKMGK